MLNIEIITKGGNIWCLTGDSISLPGINGIFQILPGHIPIISLLSEGFLTIGNAISEKKTAKVQQGIAKFKIFNGTVKNINNKIIIIGEISVI